MLEIFRGHFFLPELGPIGSNGLANGRDFLHPTAHFDKIDDSSDSTASRVWTEQCSGNYLPYIYDLQKFCAINSVSYHHPDPSEAGTTLADFVIFPPHIMATDENTFRPFWFHRNVMTEYMGLIYGEYDAKKSSSGDADAKGGFVPGGSSLHSIMTPHGPDAESYYDNVCKPCKEPTKFDGGLAFMFESSAMCKVSKYALGCEQREQSYACCWDGFKNTFPDMHA